MSGVVEATLRDVASASDVRDALARARRAGAWLRAQPATTVIDALAGALDRLRDPRDTVRLELESALPAATGFTAETVRDGLPRALMPWSGDALRALAARELGAAFGDDARAGPLARGFDATAVILGGSLPMPTLLDLIAPLAVRSPVVVKTARHDRVTAPLFTGLLRAIEPRLGACVELLHFDSTSTECLDALLEADCIAATGDDDTIDALRARIDAPRRFVGRGHRVSFACIGADTLTPQHVDDLGRALALDVASWDQLGCLSPIFVHVVGRDRTAAARVADALARALSEEAVRIPRGHVPLAAAAAIAQERASAELRAADGRAVHLAAAGQHGFTVVLEDDPALRAAPLHRFVRVHAVESLEHTADALLPLSGRIAGIALAGFAGHARDEAVRMAVALGASRICAPGTLQSPPLGWHHEGEGVLLPFVRLTDDECADD